MYVYVCITWVIPIGICVYTIMRTSQSDSFKSNVQVAQHIYLYLWQVIGG